MRKEKIKILKKIRPASPSNQGEMSILWSRLTLGLGMIGRVGWQLSRTGDFTVCSPPLIKTWSIFTHGH